MNEFQPTIPRELARLVHRCLAKNVVDRYQSALDLRHASEQTKQDVDSGDALATHQPTHLASRSMRMPVAILAALAVAIAASLWVLEVGRKPTGLTAPRVQNAVQVSAALGVESYPTWSPDGVRLAYQASEEGYSYVGNHDIWVTQLGSGEPVNLTKAELVARWPRDRVQFSQGGTGHLARRIQRR